MPEFLVGYEHEEYIHAETEEGAVNSFRINHGLTEEEHEKRIRIDKIADDAEL